MKLRTKNINETKGRRRNSKQIKKLVKEYIRKNKIY